MRSTAHSSFATLLLLAPILAIPMLAIFGVPQFAPVVESPHDLDPSAASAPHGDAPAFRSVEQWEEAAFDASEAAQQAAWSQEQPAELDQTAVPTPGAEVTLVSAAPVPRAQSFPDLQSAPALPTQGQHALTADMAAAAAAGVYRRPRVEPAASSAPSPNRASSTRVNTPNAGERGLTWKAAVDRLNRMEIRNFRLEPGQQNGQFLFICSYTPRHNPRVSYRFEAEADEPLRAVEKVLEQIDTWMASR